MDGGNNGSFWIDIFNSGLAFFLAVIGWVWHAARLATKVESLEKRLDEHMRTTEEMYDELKLDNEKAENKLDVLRDRMNEK